jgi:hypothetical protein
MNKIYANIKAIRLAKGLKQEDVAEKLGLAPSNYGRVERGLTEISVERLEKIAEIFEMSVSNVLNYDQENPVDFKEDFEYYYNLSKKLAKQVEKLKDEDYQRDEEEREDNSRKSREIDSLKTKIKQLQDKIKEKEAIILERDKTIADKDKMIGILEKAIDMIGAK